ncbi:MAG: hypothetical protein P0Y62_13075 [Candidatus Chryseobacterium colombiense]|nr:hypothetical protein [Chryseobacterium sp.]WEK68780.1 MAG: hypothetical protein P0Y62_13075 [Chryseobacterium sp.]
METAFQHQARLQYAEVYASDILELKNLFLQKFRLNMVNASFGIPFLLIKKGNGIVAFASLVINKNNQIDFEIYENPELTISEKEDFKKKAKNYCERNDSENFRDPEELTYNIRRMVDWLNN